MPGAQVGTSEKLLQKVLVPHLPLRLSRFSSCSCVSSGYFSRAMGVWSKKNSLTSRFITNLISHTEAEHATGAWLLLSKVASLSTELPCSKILDAFHAVVRCALIHTHYHTFILLRNSARFFSENVFEDEL